MTAHTDGLHHFHARKRIHQLHEDYPHPNKAKRFMDKAIYVVGIIGPLMTIPQLAKIWIEKNASGVSAASWTAYTVCAIFWLIYGFMHREKPIIITYAVWLLLDAAIIVGVALY